MGSSGETTEHGDLDAVLCAAAGAFLGALPLLYTMEMWWYGRVIGEPLLLSLLAATSGVVVLSLLFGGFRRGRISHLGVDTAIAYGVGLVVALVTLLVVGRIQPGRVPLDVAARMVALETIPCAIGAALAMTQFRPRKRKVEHVDRRVGNLPQDVQKILATLVGAIFFAFNVAPTEEPWKMTMEATPTHFPLVALFSIMVSYVIVFEADFADHARGDTDGALGHPLAETFVSYAISLAVSYGFLVAFGRITTSTPFYWQVAATVMMGYVTTIGGSAGRVLVAE